MKCTCICSCGPAGEDYVATTEMVTFDPGERTKVVRVPLLDDVVLEGMERFLGRLTSEEEDIVFAPGMAIMTIIEDDSELCGTIT